MAKAHAAAFWRRTCRPPGCECGHGDWCLTWLGGGIDFSVRTERRSHRNRSVRPMAIATAVSARRIRSQMEAPGRLLPFRILRSNALLPRRPRPAPPVLCTSRSLACVSNRQFASSHGECAGNRAVMGRFLRSSMCIPTTPYPRARIRLARWRGRLCLSDARSISLLPLLTAVAVKIFDTVNADE